jgi:hypothetical protein
MALATVDTNAYGQVDPSKQIESILNEYKAFVARRDDISKDRYDYEGSYDHDIFGYPRKGVISYDGQFKSCGGCMAPVRLQLNQIRLKSSKLSAAAVSEAAKTIARDFDGIAVALLAPYADLPCKGFPDLPDTVCRYRPKGKSAILPPPYFDEIEYTVRLVKDEPEPPESGPRPNTLEPDTTLFRVLISASVNVTKNPGSAYREGTDAELSPYGDALKKVAVGILDRSLKPLRQGGWRVMPDFEYFDLIPPGSSQNTGK